MKDIVTPVPQEEVRCTIKNCLEAAALVNYERVSANTKIEGELGLGKQHLISGTEIFERARENILKNK